MKRRVIIRVCLVLAVLVVAHFTAQVRLVRRLDARYQQVQRGMDVGKVGVTMNRNTFEYFDKQSGEDLSGWWDNTPLSPQEAARIQGATRYTAPEFFWTVRYVFTFDENDKLVGKHRFD
jgi:hypothetical protein